MCPCRQCVQEEVEDWGKRYHQRLSPLGIAFEKVEQVGNMQLHSNLEDIVGESGEIFIILIGRRQ